MRKAPSSSPLPVVSAIINTYNYGHFVEEAVESVLAQEYPAELLDVIVVDDGSADDTAERMKRFGERVRYFALPHRGQASALNFGIGQARGEIVAFLDADDLWVPQKVRRVVDAIQAAPDAGLVYHAFVPWRTDGRPVAQQDFQALSGHLTTDIRKLLAFDGQATSGQAFRMEVLQQMLPLPEAFQLGCSDGYMAYNSIFEWPAVAIAEPLARYRIHGENHFSFDKRDPEKLKAKLSTWRALMGEHRSWLERRGHNLQSPATAAFLLRQEITAELLEFGIENPGRAAYFRHLRKELKLYAPIWSPSYRMFKAASAAAGFLLGFERSHSLRKTYQHSVALRAKREAVAPRMRRRNLSKAASAR
ncbi:MAG TPA: glycosyltransferase family 2 protein [Candidatus Acidoferrales bacterium]|nr:glycosyltransferase family 2 protein [Candidatus Acidoferrales bacterium]